MPIGDIRIVPDEPHNHGRPVAGGGSGSEQPAFSGKDLRQANYVTIRPAILTAAHLYNLRNQGWMTSRLLWGGDDNSVGDPIQLFQQDANVFPSNADSVNPALYANTQSSHDKTLTRFNVKDLVKNSYGTSQAANGYYIIDALVRGPSRMANVAQSQTQYATAYSLGTINADTTPGGATCVCGFAGRVFYAGFSGEVQDPDANSPRMSSYVLFSPTVTDISSITNCYQVGDPTNKDDSALVDTDGGFIRVEGAYGIVGLAAIGVYVAVVAHNGVWLISGGNNYGFSATNYKVTKVTNNGCNSPGSIIAVENSLFYWGPDGIYNLAPNAYGDYISTNISMTTIQQYFQAIDPVDVTMAEGIYDSYEKKIRWVYGNRTSANNPNKELVFDLILRAFYPSTITKLGNGTGNRFPMMVKGVLVDPYILQTNANWVTTSTGDTVTTSTGDQIAVDSTATYLSGQVREVKYLCLTQGSPTISYTFATYNNPSHIDWKSVDTVGVDAPAYLITGALSGGDFQRVKDVPYVTFYFRKTETGFQDDGNGDFTPTNQSSCLVSPMWNWCNNPNSNKWGRQFQAYRHNRQYFPTDITDVFNDGASVVKSRSRLRGFGAALSLRLDSEPAKHMELLGWSMIFEGNNDI